jgi:hypothetical protein
MTSHFVAKHTGEPDRHSPLHHMSFVNNYTPPEPAASLSDPYGPEPWDINFIFPVPPAIENDVVKLIPFVPRLHLAAYWAAGADDPALYEYLTNLHTTPQRMLEHVLHGREDPGWCTFLVIDKSKPEADESRGLGGAVAGTMAYVNTSAAQRVSLLALKRESTRELIAVCADDGDRRRDYCQVRSAVPRRKQCSRAAHELRTEPAFGPGVPRPRSSARGVVVSRGEHAVAAACATSRLPA